MKELNLKDKKIVFLGNMNNFPYEYAREFVKRGLHVTFIVEADKNNMLDRPESLDKRLKNNYPDWIQEQVFDISLKAFKFSLPRIFLKKYIDLVNRFDIIILNGFWLSIAKFIQPHKKTVALIAGYELDILANKKSINYLVSDFYRKTTGLKKFIPHFLARFLFNRLVDAQRAGIKRIDIVDNGPAGVNPDSDQLLQQIKAEKPFKLIETRGFDCTKFPYLAPDAGKEKFTILNITRFFYLNKRHDNKRNDLMIKGIGNFIRLNNISTDQLEILFFEKGEDIDDAKKLCDENGLTPFIAWQKETDVEGLNRYFAVCDVAFDQLGVHWVGAGLFSMLAGRPLIANGRPDIYEKITNVKSPVCQATSAEEVETWLTKLYANRQLVEEIGLASRSYVLKYHNINYSIENLISTLS